MKILYIITKSEIGGAQRHVYQLMKDMVAKGHTVGLMSYPGGWLEEEAKALGVTFYRNYFFKNSFNPLLALRAIASVKKALYTFKPDIVSCHSSMAGILGRIAIRNKVPTIFTAHSWAFTDGAPLLRKYIAIAAEKIASRYTSKIICVSKFDQDLAVRYGIASREKLIAIYNGVEISAENVSKEDTQMVTILSVGRLAYPKRIDLLIEAFADLSESLQNRAQLIIVGDGSQKEMLAEKIRVNALEDRIFLKGGLSHIDVLHMMYTADIFALISKHEGFPMTIIEAMDAGLPVIASRVGGIPEEIDSLSGVLVGNNKTEITRALTLLIGQKESRISMGKSAKDRVRTFFSVEQFLNKTEAVYAEVFQG